VDDAAPPRTNEPSASEAPEGQESVARPASRVAIATAGSRVGGLLRESVFAALIGAAWQADAFFLAFRIPNLLRDFFAEGALASAFVPTLARTQAQEGRARALLLARRTMGTLAIVTGLVAVLGIVFAPQVVSVIAPHAEARTRELTVLLTRIMFPFLPLVALAAVCMGLLNTERRYFVPALAPMFFNIVAVLGGGLLLLLGWSDPSRVGSAVVVWSILVVLGGVAQVAVQLPSLRRVGWRGAPLIDLRFRDPALRQIAKRMGPIVLSVAGVNVMVLIITALSSQGEGWPSWLSYAFRLVHLPIGLIGVALGTVVLAATARRAAAGDAKEVDVLVRKGIRLVWFLALPAAVGLAVFSEPLVRMLYERGRFLPTDTLETAGALRAYAVGIVFYAGVKAAAPQFLSRGDTRTPMLCSLAGVGMTIAVAFATVGAWGHRGLAFAVATGSATNYLCLRALGRRAHGDVSAPSLGFLARVVGATVVMGLLGWGTVSVFGHDLAVASRWLEALVTVLAILALGLLYFLVAAALGVEEVSWVRRRLGGGPGKPSTPGSVS
jgi:putative peptidoglycan lipid II flippase